jgi:(R,R)-butanediol dehydrogenase/meso-butanediol dehydrogenase/diacetyl reductase
MRALVYHGNKDLRLESVPDPVPGPGEVKLHIDYCGICATDIEEYLYGPVFISSDTPNPITGKKIPLITGHEITGTVVETGESVTDLRAGDRTVLNTVLTCGKCRGCLSHQETQCPNMAVAGFALDGGLAEFMVWRASEVIKLPDNVSSEQAALVEPASVALHAVRRSRLQPGETVVVLGCGTVGLLAMQAARAMGGRVLAVDRRQMSLDVATDLGADGAVNSADAGADDRLRELTGPDGPDLVIDAAGGEHTPAQAVDWVRAGGRVLLVAIYTAKPAFDFNSLVSTEKEIIGSLGYQRRDVEEVVRLISSGDLRTAPLISDKIGLEDVIDKGFARMLAPSKDVFRILVSPPS